MQRPKKNYSEDFKDEVIQYYLNNPSLTYKQIEEKYFVSKCTFYRWAKERGINLKGLDYRPRRYSLIEDCFKQETAEKYYWLGFISADGNVSKDGYCLTIDLKSIDEGHLQHFLDFCGSNSPLFYYTNNQNVKVARVSICSKIIVKDLEKYNIVPNKSLIYNIPEEIIPSQFLSHFLRGLFDGDGTCSITKKAQPVFRFCSRNQTCCEQFSRLMGVNKKPTLSGNTWHFTVEGINKAVPLFDYLYQNSAENIRLQRKYEKYKSFQKVHDEYLNRPINK